VELPALVGSFTTQSSAPRVGGKHGPLRTLRPKKSGSNMPSMFDERSWLEWLVKVRILILTFLLGIELLISQFTATSLPVRPFVTAILLWYTLSIFYVVLLSFWREQHVQSVLQV
jgi:predicted Na+-dependent transporter